MTAVKSNWHSVDLHPLKDETLAQLDGWWRAANYLSVGQIYLLDNPLLRTPWGAKMSSHACSATGEPRRA